MSHNSTVTIIWSCMNRVPMRLPLQVSAISCRNWERCEQPTRWRPHSPFVGSVLHRAATRLDRVEFVLTHHCRLRHEIQLALRCVDIPPRSYAKYSLQHGSTRICTISVLFPTHVALILDADHAFYMVASEQDRSRSATAVVRPSCSRYLLRAPLATYSPSATTVINFLSSIPLNGPLGLAPPGHCFPTFWRMLYATRSMHRSQVVLPGFA